MFTDIYNTNKKYNIIYADPPWEYRNMGNIQAAAEVCLIGVKGKPPKVSNKVSSIVESTREQHSKKPDIIRKKKNCRIFRRYSPN